MGNANLVGHLRRLVVFDLDGTLVDSRRDLANAANALIEERGGRLLSEDAIGRMVGDGAAMLVQRALTAAELPFDEESVRRFLALYDERLLETTVPYPGIPEALDAIAPSATIAVLTNKPLAPSQRILDALGLSRHVVETLGGDGPFPKKPDPAALKHLVQSFGAAAADTVMVGDSRIDYETARGAGTAACLASYGFGLHGLDVAALDGNAKVVDGAAELPGAIAKLLGL